MAQNIKLNSSEWCNMVFSGKNQAYGAYVLRTTSSKRHLTAFITGMLFVGIAAAIPSFINAVKPTTLNTGGIDQAFVLSVLTTPDEQIAEDNIIKADIAPPPLPLRATLQFTPPVITEDNRLDKNREMKGVDEILEKKDLQISFVTNESGRKSTDAIAPEELRSNKIIVQDTEPEKPFVNVEQKPQYPGGDAELMRFVASTLRYPTIAAENGIEGRVVIRFVVGKDGQVSDIRIVKTLDPSCDKEAVRVVQSMPRWVPGMQNGRAVAVYYNLPILFRLQK